jgi:hypothetical protein
MADGDQNFFPVYEPDADALRKKWREAEEEARAHHYDSTKEGKCLPRACCPNLHRTIGTSANPQSE